MLVSGWCSGTWTRRGVALICAAIFASAGAVAQTIENLPLARGYGAGVHAYFSGDYDRSYDDLSAVIAAGSPDPRARYFRGLAALRLGRLDEAEADFSEGAMLEAAALGSWPVSRSLERVQGHDRLRLERHRGRARIAAVEQSRAAERARYSGISDVQQEILRRRRPIFDGPAVDAANPFADRPTEASPAAEPLPTPDPADAPAENPPLEMPADEDPFAPKAAPGAEPEAPGEPEMPAEPAAEAPATEEQPPLEAAADGVESEPAIEDPFGGNAVPAEDAPSEGPAAPGP